MYVWLVGDVNQSTTLIEKGDDVNGGRDSMTALHIAAATANGDLTRTLLSHGANVEARDIYGQTALHVAAFSDARDVIALLIRDGAHVDYGNAESPESSADAFAAAGTDFVAVGWTPLHCAADQGDIGTAGVLMNARANIMATTSDGSTCFYVVLDYVGA